MTFSLPSPLSLLKLPTREFNYGNDNAIKQKERNFIEVSSRSSTVALIGDTVN